MLDKHLHNPRLRPADEFPYWRAVGFEGHGGSSTVADEDRRRDLAVGCLVYERKRCSLEPRGVRSLSKGMSQWECKNRGLGMTYSTNSAAEVGFDLDGVTGGWAGGGRRICGSRCR